MLAKLAYRAATELSPRLAAKAAAAPRLSRSEGESINRSNATAKAVYVALRYDFDRIAVSR